MEPQQQALASRCSALERSMMTRKRRLQDSLKLQQLFRNTEWACILEKGTKRMVQRCRMSVRTLSKSKKFNDYRADSKANEVRLVEMNEMAVQLIDLGQTETALKIQTQS
ncbi:hypothetical protein QAD02_002346 [Eretmocerus hayati]|uniref:Uncharacterized protein n=1 Tax=Eretmocerus hayati TaxID=131215 RepID=A0ACC2NJ03_9HYME|nr:hypothetical protein QAD02_002346 [Eretmocerus hayati]